LEDVEFEAVGGFGVMDGEESDSGAMTRAGRWRGLLRSIDVEIESVGEEAGQARVGADGDEPGGVEGGEPMAKWSVPERSLSLPSPPRTAGERVAEGRERRAVHG